MLLVFITLKGIWNQIYLRMPIIPASVEVATASDRSWRFAWATERIQDQPGQLNKTAIEQEEDKRCEVRD